MIIFVYIHWKLSWSFVHSITVFALKTVNQTSQFNNCFARTANLVVHTERPQTRLLHSKFQFIHHIVLVYTTVFIHFSKSIEILEGCKNFEIFLIHEIRILVKAYGFSGPIYGKYRLVINSLESDYLDIVFKEHQLCVCLCCCLQFL